MYAFSCRQKTKTKAKSVKEKQWRIKLKSCEQRHRCRGENSNGRFSSQQHTPAPTLPLTRVVMDGGDEEWRKKNRNLHLITQSCEVEKNKEK